jgi:hypothetical protein
MSQDNIDSNMALSGQPAYQIQSDKACLLLRASIAAFQQS